MNCGTNRPDALGGLAGCTKDTAQMIVIPGLL